MQYIYSNLVCCFSLEMVALTAIIAVVAWLLDVLGHDPGAKGPSWCWIKPKVDFVPSLFWQYMTGKCWEITCYFITAITYALIKRRLNKQVEKMSELSTDLVVNCIVCMRFSCALNTIHCIT